MLKLLDEKSLHVDSDDLLRSQVSAYLTKEGHDIAGSGSVEAALEILLGNLCKTLTTMPA
jgi:DNA-binding response OmpR family regulator